MTGARAGDRPHRSDEAGEGRDLTGQHEADRDDTSRSEGRVLARSLGRCRIASDERIGRVGQAVEMHRPGDDRDDGDRRDRTEPGSASGPARTTSGTAPTRPTNPPTRPNAAAPGRR